MHYVKCLDISQVPEPTLQDVPRIIWVTTGELYVDLPIAGEPLRIKISDVVARKALPENDKLRTAAIYFNDNKYKYYAEGVWHTIATVSEITDESRNLTVADLFNAVFDDTTGLAKLNSNVDDLILLLSGEAGLVSRVTAAEKRVEELYQAVVTNSTAITDMDASIAALRELVGEVSTLIDGLSVSVTDHTARLSSVETTVTTLQETTITGIVNRLSAIESTVSGSNDRLTALEQADASLTTRVEAIEQSLDGLLITLENI